MTITRNVHPTGTVAWLGEMYRAGRFLDPTYKVPLGSYEPTLTYVGVVAGLRYSPRSLRDAGLDHQSFLDRHDFAAWRKDVLARAIQVRNRAAFTELDAPVTARDRAKMHGPRGKGKRS
jgi:hypothetical protein